MTKAAEEGRRDSRGAASAAARAPREDRRSSEDWVWLPRPVYVGAGVAPLVGRILGADMLQEIAGHQFQRLLGFWFCWHSLGGLHAMIDSGLWSRGGVYNQLKEFRGVFGCSPDELLPEFALELAREAVEWPERFPEPRPIAGKRPYSRRPLAR